MKIIAIDYGLKRIGLATGTMELKIALPLCVIEATGYAEKDAQAVIRKSNELEGQIDLFVVGLPKNMNGTEGGQAEITRNFAHWLEKLSKVTVVLEDERLTTFAADSRFEIPQKSNKKRKTYKPSEGLDAVSAAIILERYFQKQ